MSASDNLSDGQFWHGSPSGDMRGSHYGLHIGTRQSAKEALEARIGRPAEGEWDGTREYGRTLLNRDIVTHGYDHETKTWTRNVEPRPPSYPSVGAGYSDGTKVALDAVPDIFPVNIIGGMTNTPQTPHEDFKANGMMAGQIKRGRAKNGYFYENVAEDVGSISAVVPNGDHVEKVPQPPRQMRLFG